MFRIDTYDGTAFISITKQADRSFAFQLKFHPDVNE